jgi:hypothetical protein
MKEEVEILWKGIVHYRRSKGDPVVNETEELIKKGNTLYSIRRVEDIK